MYSHWCVRWHYYDGTNQFTHFQLEGIATASRDGILIWYNGQMFAQSLWQNHMLSRDNILMTLNSWLPHMTYHMRSIFPWKPQWAMIIDNTQKSELQLACTSWSLPEVPVAMLLKYLMHYSTTANQIFESVNGCVVMYILNSVIYIKEIRYLH